MKIIDALEFLRIYPKISSQTLPIKLAYKLNKLNCKIKNDGAFYEESLEKILQEYAEIDEKGNFIQNEAGDGIVIKEGLVNECHQKIKELQELSLETSDIFFTIEELEPLSITPAELNCLFSLIKE